MVVPSFMILHTASFRGGNQTVVSGSSSPTKMDHPIEQLIKSSRADFSATVERQSKTVKEAVAAYRRRYGLDPPRGFPQWFRFAKSQNYVLVDEFDSIYESFSQFWRFPVATLRKNMRQAPALDDHLYLCRYKNGVFKGNCGWHGNDINLIMSSMAHLLPDVEFLLNTADGPRVLISDDPNEVGTHGNLFKAHVSIRVTATFPKTQTKKHSQLNCLSLKTFVWRRIFANIQSMLTSMPYSCRPPMQSSPDKRFQS